MEQSATELTGLLFEKCALFSGIDSEACQKLLSCLGAAVKSIPKDGFLLHAGDSVERIYILLSGYLHIVEDDFWGDRFIIETLEAFTLFGEAYVLAGREEQLVSVVAAEDSRVLVIAPDKLLKTCSAACDFHARLIRNIACILSEKIVRLTEKLGYVTGRTTREKLLAYLSRCAQHAKSNAFSIPYSRQQLADYLAVDRSALSHELGKMQKAGLLRYRKNHFELL